VATDDDHTQSFLDDPQARPVRPVAQFLKTIPSFVFHKVTSTEWASDVSIVKKLHRPPTRLIPWAQLGHHLSSATVDVCHLLHLVIPLTDVGLVDAYRVGPQGSVAIGQP
jgi:hypothetical protein